MKMSRLIQLSFLMSLSLGCSGLQVDRLSLTDPRLPVDARRWVADAEDAVVISRAKRDEAVESYSQSQVGLNAVLATSAYKGSDGAAAKMKQETLALARVDAARQARDLADAELNLSKARLRLIYAETAMRQDISVYNMPPLQAAVDQALALVVKLRDSHRRAREAELKATDEWWAAWQKLAASKGDTRPFWTGGRN